MRRARHRVLSRPIDAVHGLARPIYRGVRDDLRQTVEKVVSVARVHDVSVPERTFTAEQQDDDDTDRSARSERRLAQRTTKGVWQTAKSLVGPVVDFDRPDDTEIHDNAFLELHTYLGCRQDLYAETGAGDFAEDTTRDRIPTGSYHRDSRNIATVTHSSSTSNRRPLDPSPRPSPARRPDHRWVFPSSHRASW